MPERAAQEIRGLAVLLLSRLEAIENPTMAHKRAIGHAKACRTQAEACCRALADVAPVTSEPPGERSGRPT